MAHLHQLPAREISLAVVDTGGLVRQARQLEQLHQVSGLPSAIERDRAGLDRRLELGVVHSRDGGLLEVIRLRGRDRDLMIRR